MNNHYFLLRHGQTIFKTKHKDIIYPWPEKKPIGLTKRGKAKIQKVAQKIKKKGIDLIYSSDFFRTCQTAGIVAKELGLFIKLDKRLREINLGIFRGRPMAEYQKFFQKEEEKFFRRPPKGENWNDVRKRLTSFLKELEKKYKNKKILIISHGDPLWLLEGIIKGVRNKAEILKMREDFYPQVGELKKLTKT